MKKLIKIFTVIGLLCLCGCGKTSSLKTISYEQLDQKLKNKESFVLYIGSTTCSHCQEFKPTLEKVVKDKNLTVYYIDMSTVTDSEYAAVSNKTNLQGTPTVLIVNKGKCASTNRIIGTQEYDATLDFFKDNGYIK